MRRIKLEQTRALRSAMERRQERRRLILRFLAVFAMLMLMVALAMFLTHRAHLSLPSATATVLCAVS